MCAVCDPPLPSLMPVIPKFTLRNITRLKHRQWLGPSFNGIILSLSLDGYALKTPQTSKRIIQTDQDRNGPRVASTRSLSNIHNCRNEWEPPPSARSFDGNEAIVLMLHPGKCYFEPRNHGLHRLVYAMASIDRVHEDRYATCG